MSNCCAEDITIREERHGCSKRIEREANKVKSNLLIWRICICALTRAQCRSLCALACAGVNLKVKSATHARYCSLMCVLRLDRPQHNLYIFLESPILWVPSTTHKTCSPVAWKYLAWVYSHSIVFYFNLWRTNWLNIDLCMVWICRL